MEPFLDNVAKKIIASKTKMDQVKIIVPSIRAVTFLKESLKKFIIKPLIAPEIVTISDFIAELSEIESLSKTDLIYMFYKIYKESTPESTLESLNQFFSWAPALLTEFNEIDNQLVNPKELFNFMNAIDSIQTWGTSGKGDLSKYHFKLQKNVPSYYNLLYKKIYSIYRFYDFMKLADYVINFFSE